MKALRHDGNIMVKFRLCREEDFGEVVRLLGQLWPEKQVDRKLMREAFSRGLASDSQLYLCAVVEDRIIGFSSLTIKNSMRLEGHLGNIDEMIIDEPYRGKGIGSRLLQRVIGEARDRGCAGIELESALHRPDAHRFYESHGFENRALLFTMKI